MTKLGAGTKAVDFNLPDYLGNAINLRDYRGKRVLLSFFRGASCPFCNLRVQELIKRHSDFEKEGIYVIGLFASTQEEIRKYAGKQKPPFPIIPDPTLSLYKSYRVDASKLVMLKAMMQPGKMWRVITSGFFNMNAVVEKPLIPADFLIDGTGIIERSYYGKDFGDHLPIKEIIN